MSKFLHFPNLNALRAGFTWHGVRNLSIKDIKLYNHKIYAQIATNVVNRGVLSMVTKSTTDAQGRVLTYGDISINGVNY